VDIFVGNLALTTTEQDLRERFEPYGSVDAIRIMTDRGTGRSRGCGFVEMPDTRAAQTAMDALNGTSLAGRVLTVNAARPREPRREPRQPRWEANASRRVVPRVRARITAASVLGHARIQPRQGRPCCHGSPER
jgi:RNA recognition motif-containing protein